MEPEQGLSISAALHRRAERGASSEELGRAVAAAWREIESSLVPIVGPHGLKALYQRSLLLTSRSYPWLAEISTERTGLADVDALERALALQVGETAAAGGGELLQTFYGLVRNLVGDSLARRLLGSLWEAFH